MHPNSQITVASNSWEENALFFIYIGFFFVILIGLIPTIIINILRYKWINFFLQYQGICWLNSSFIFQFISIPIIIFIG